MCSPCGLSQGLNHKDAAPKHHPQVGSYFFCITMTFDKLFRLRRQTYNGLEKWLDEEIGDLNSAHKDGELRWFYDQLQSVNERDGSYL
jgi:hypothetical protein